MCYLKSWSFVQYLSHFNLKHSIFNHLYQTISQKYHNILIMFIRIFKNIFFRKFIRYIHDCTTILFWKLKSFYAKSWNDRSRVTVNNEQIEFCRKRHYQYGIFTLKRTKIMDLICEWTIELYFRKRSHFNDREARKDVYPTIRMGEFRNFLTVRRLKMERLHRTRHVYVYGCFMVLKCIRERDRVLWWL